MTARMFAEVLYDALGWELPPSESFRRPDEDEGDGSDDEAPAKESEVQQAEATELEETDTSSRRRLDLMNRKFFHAPVPAPDADRLRRAVGVIFSEVLEGFAKLHKARHANDELDVDMSGAAWDLSTRGEEARSQVRRPHHPAEADAVPRGAPLGRRGSHPALES